MTDTVDCLDTKKEELRKLTTYLERENQNLRKELGYQPKREIFSLACQKKGDCLILKPLGDLIKRIKNLRQRVDSFLESYPQTKSIAFDCTQLRHVDSSGVWEIFALRQKLEKQGIFFALCCLKDNVFSSFFVTGIHKAFTIKEEKEDVLAFLEEKRERIELDEMLQKQEKMLFNLKKSLLVGDIRTFPLLF